jgi:hypothetical protein
MILAETIQKAELHVDGGIYSRQHFLTLVNNMSPEDFNSFCKESLHLCEFYARTVGCFATDQQSVATVFPELVWELEQIDFTQPVHFRKIID